MIEKTAFDRMREIIAESEDFQNACKRYHHEGGSSAAIAAACLRVMRAADWSAVIDAMRHRT